MGAIIGLIIVIGYLILAAKYSRQFHKSEYWKTHNKIISSALELAAFIIGLNIACALSTAVILITR